jgi:hypothetical protein
MWKNTGPFGCTKRLKRKLIEDKYYSVVSYKKENVGTLEFRFVNHAAVSANMFQLH